MLAPLGANQITLMFDHFATERYRDTVQVFQCQNIECLPSQNAKIAELSGSYATVQNFTSSTGYMLIEFTSDSGISDDGFNATWTSDAPSLPEVFMHT
jgi:hypothetical protein